MDNRLSQREVEIFETMSVPKAVAALAVPTVISQIIAMVYNLADTWYIGQLNDTNMMAAVTPQTKLAAVTHVSNVTGRLDPIEAIIRLVHEQGGVVLVDAAQSAPHMPIDVQELDADFLAFSGHKLMAPMGIGVLYGKKALLEDMPPFLSGGEMIDSVSRFDAVYAPLPHKFEAGTVNGGGAVALQAAIEYMEGIGWREINRAADRDGYGGDEAYPRCSSDRKH